MDKTFLKLLYNLPIEVKYKIIPYLYRTQSINLLEDIISYTKTKNEILNLYKIIYQHNYKGWLVNDIIRYINDFLPLLWGYSGKIYTILCRNIYIKKKIIKDIGNSDLIKIKEEKIVVVYMSDICEKLNIYLYKFNNYSLNKQLNILWGLLTIEERNECYKKLLMK